MADNSKYSQYSTSTTSSSSGGGNNNNKKDEEDEIIEDLERKERAPKKYTVRRRLRHNSEPASRLKQAQQKVKNIQYQRKLQLWNQNRYANPDRYFHMPEPRGAQHHEAYKYGPRVKYSSSQNEHGEAFAPMPKRHLPPNAPNGAYFWLGNQWVRDDPAAPWNQNDAENEPPARELAPHPDNEIAPGIRRQFNDDIPLGVHNNDDDDDEEEHDPFHTHHHHHYPHH